MNNRVEQSAHLSAEKQAILAIQRLQAKYEALEKAKSEPIAVIGMDCRFPGGANNPEAFWQLLCDGVDAITEVPPQRWDINTFYSPDVFEPGKMNSRFGGFLDQVDQFDASFFGISPREAASMDPQQRLLLETSWHALEQAGQNIDQLAGSSTGVFVGASNSDYYLLQLGYNTIDGTFTETGNRHSFLSGRLSYLLNFKGPCVTIDTVCSSSLVAVHLACQSLRNKEIDLALTGSANLILAPISSVLAAKLQVLSPDGSCKTFDAGANGFVRGEGCGVVVLKRLSDALAAGDPILALIRGSAVNQDGRSASLTAPNVLSQQELIRQALANAGVDPALISYVETHGTATSLGDPIEIAALSAIVGQPRSNGLSCFLGAVKTNIGHLEATSGMASLIKTILCLQHQTIPANLHFEKLNPHISLENTPFIFPKTAQPWLTGKFPRYAGVNAFGLSGTNAHLVLEEAPALLRETAVESDQRLFLLPLSARSPEALLALAHAYQSFLQESTDTLQDICYTASIRRSHHPERYAVVGTSKQECAEALQLFQEDAVQKILTAPRKMFTQQLRTVFVFPGQGSQWSGMGRDLLEQEPVFRQAMQRCAQAIEPLVSWSLLDVLADPSPEALAPIDVIQPVLFAIQVSLAALWHSWGVSPDAVIGHSMGEVAAAHVAGILSLEDAARVICRRSRLLRRISGQGAMALVELSLSQAEILIVPWADRLSVAVSNSPRSTVLSGDPTALASVLQQLETQGVFSRWVKVDVASHSPQVDSLRLDLLEALADLHPQVGLVPLYSTVTAAPIEGTLMDAAYWFDNLRQPVRFSHAVTQLIGEGYLSFVELSPHPILKTALEEIMPHSDCTGLVLGSLYRGEAGRASLLASLATCYEQGYDLSWPEFFAGSRQYSVALPLYPWQRERFWLDLPAGNADTWSQPRAQRSFSSHPFLDTPLPLAPLTNNYYWSIDLETEASAYLQDHRLQDQAVLPGAAYLDMMLSAAREVAGAKVWSLEHIHFKELLVLSARDQRNIQLVLDYADPKQAFFRFFSQRVNGQEGASSWILHADGMLRTLGLPEGDVPLPPPTYVVSPLSKIQDRCHEVFTKARYYTMLATYGLRYGPAFQGIQQLWRRDGEALAHLQLETEVAEEDSYQVHPALLDAALQAMLATMPTDTSAASENRVTYLPVKIEQLRSYQKPAREAWAHVILHHEDSAAEKDHMTVGDVFLLGPDGQVVLEILGLHVQRVATQAQRLPQDELQSWLYELHWQAETDDAAEESLAPTSLTGTRGTWLIFADQRTTVSSALKESLTARGENCVLVTAGQNYERVTTERYRLDPFSPADFGALLKDLDHHEQHCCGVLYLWGLDTVADEEIAQTDLLSTQEFILGGALYLIQALALTGWRHTPRLWLITQGVQVLESSPVAQGFLQASLWGLGQTVVYEQPSLHCTRIDLSADISPEELVALSHACRLDEPEDQIVLRGQTRYIARLKHYTPAVPTPETGSNLVPAGYQAFRLEVSQPGILASLQLQAMQRPQPQPTEIEIEVIAAGLNFIDVLLALGTYPGQTPEDTILGRECAGRVVAVGSEVKEFRVGDNVVAIALGSIGTHVTVSVDSVVHKPSHLSFPEAASLPIVFVTAYYALYQLGGLVSGERILIHSAAGGTGLAAVQLAQHIGAEIFATAGTHAKREYLRSLGIKHVMDSRSLDFVEQIRLLTNGEGIDVVLNSLAGEAAASSLALLGPSGRFLEIGKKDIYENNLLSLSPFRRSLSYIAIDLAQIMGRHPHRLKILLNEVMRFFIDGTFKPLLLTAFSLNEIPQAFQALAQGKHIGKFVISLENRQQARIKLEDSHPTLFYADKTYLITGGLGGLGLTIAQWMVEQGAKTLVLVGRSVPSEQAEAQLLQMRQSGAQVHVRQADVADGSQVGQVLSFIRTALPALHGVFHAAGVLDDVMLLNMEPQHVRTVMRPKLLGAYHLHTLTQQDELDYFVLFSSAASLPGSPGQGNYAAANALLDSLAHHRRAKGLAALSINWGPWAEVGLAAAQTGRGQRLATLGIASIAPQQGTEALGRLLSALTPAQVAVIPLNIRQWRQSYPAVANLPLFADLQGELPGDSPQTDQALALRVSLQAASPSERQTLLENLLREQVAQVLRLNPAKIDRKASFKSVGLESLLAVELRNRLENKLGMTLPVVIIWTYPMIHVLAEHLATKLDMPPEVENDHKETQSITTQPEAYALSDVDGLSDEKIAELLLEELRDVPVEFLD